MAAVARSGVPRLRWREPERGCSGSKRLALGEGTLILSLVRPLRAVLIAVLALALCAPVASAATRLVDQGVVDCPNADLVSIQQAVDDAQPGDTIKLCPGLYREGSPGPASSALVIGKSLDIVGAGADRVRIEPAGDIGIAAAPTVRDGVGNVVQVSAPGPVNISGVTVAAGDPDAARGMNDVEEGVVFQNTSGSFRNSRVTDLVPAATPDFSTGVGLGVVAFAKNASTPVTFGLSGTRIYGYAKGGVLIDVDNSPSLTADIAGNVIRGRGLRDAAGQGQNGIQVSGEGARATVRGNTISDHFFTPDESSSVAVLLFGLTTADIQATQIEGNDFHDNGYGVFNAGADGCDATTPVDAPSNWWGSPLGPTVTPTPPGRCPRSSGAWRARPRP